MRKVLTFLWAVSSLLATPAWAFEEEALGTTVGIDSNHGFDTRRSVDDQATGMFEGQTEPFYIRLSTQPTGTVTLRLTSSNGDVTIDTDLDTAGNQNTLIYTPSNWDSYLSAYLTAAEDDDRTGTDSDKQETATITMSASGADYDGVTGTESINVYDNDIVLVTPKILTIDEGGSATFKVKLVRQPTRNVNLNQYRRNAGRPDSLTYSPSNSSGEATLSFTASNWDTEQTITVQAAEDDDTEDEIDRSFIVDVFTSDDYYHRALSALWVQVRDNDLHLEVSPKTVSMIEGGSDTFKVKLGIRPSGNVSVSLAQSGTVNSNVSVSPTQLSFTSSNWDTERTVTVSSTRDSDFDDDTATLSLSASGGGYDNITDTVSVEIEDYKIIAAISVEDGASAGMFEGESSLLYVKLSARPSASVTVTLSSSNADVTLDTDLDTGGNQSTLTFTASNWSENQSVVMTAAEDDDRNGTDSDKQETATITMSGSGAEYAGATGTVDVIVYDNDLIMVTPKEVTIDEGGASASFTVSLARRPNSNVFVVNFIPLWWKDENDLNYSPFPNPNYDYAYLVFTPNNWNVPQTFSVSSGEDDDDSDESHRTILYGSSQGDSYYNTAVVGITTLVNDDDTPSLAIAPRTLEIDEGDESTFQIKPAIEPTDDVTVRLSSSNLDVSFSPTSLTFTPSNWRVDRTVTVAAADDPDPDDDRANITFTASGGNYEGVTDRLSVEVDDNDIPGLVLSADDLTIDEGKQKTFTVRLATLPRANVRVRLTQPSHTEVTVDTDTSSPSNQTTLNFTTSNWNTPQTVSVSAAEDDDYVEDPKTTIPLTASGGGYDSITASVGVSIVETDTVSIYVWDSENKDIERKLSVDEGGSATFMVRLTAKPQPGRTVFVEFTQPDNEDVRIDAHRGIAGLQTSISFNDQNWNSLHEVIVQASEDDDGVADKATINIKLREWFDDKGTDSIAVSVDDNDPIGLVLSNLISSNNLVMTEGTSGKFSVKLATQPSEEVSIVIAQSGTHNPDVSFSPEELTFTLSNWKDAQEVTVSSVVDDDTMNEAAKITLTASGGDYEDLAETISVVVREVDDPADLLLSLSTLRISEGPGGLYSTGTVTLKLKSRPVDDVTVAVTEKEVPHPENWYGVRQDVDISPVSLTFTPSNWDRAQTVTLTSGEDDDIEDDDHADIIFTASGGDYVGKTAKMRLNVVDDDVFSHHLDVENLFPQPVDEGKTVKWDFWLRFQPVENAPVTASFVPESSLVTVDHDTDTPGIQESTTFTSMNWLVPQEVAFSIAEDDDAWDQRVNLRLRVSTDIMITNPQYVDENNISLGGKPYTALLYTRTLLLRDNDDVGLFLSSKPLVTEGRSGKFTVKLESQPWRQDHQPNADVKLSLGPPSNALVTIDADPGTAGNQTELTFTDQNWNVAQEVRIFASDEEDLDDYSLTLPMNASGADYGSVTDSLPIDVQSNDIPGLVVLPSTRQNVNESAAATIRVKLTVVTPADVTVVMTLPDDSDLSFLTSSTLVFTPSSWNKEQSIQVSVAPDENAIDEKHSILLTASGGGGYYDGVSSRLTLTVNDGDPRGLNISRNLVMNEGGTFNFPVVLSTLPTGDVTVAIGEPTNSDVTRSPAALYFTVSNWSVPQTVIITAARDGDNANDNATMSLNVTGADYDGITESVTIDVSDNDTEGLFIYPTNLVVSEGNGNSIFVSLRSQPSGDPVTVTIGQPTNSDVLRSPTSLTFTTSNWETAQMVDITALEDDDQVNDSATIAISGGGMKGRASVTVVDNEVPGLTISPARLSLQENDVGSFTLELANPEFTPREVAVLWNRQQNSDLTYSPPSLRFDASNWTSRQEVLVSVASDDDAIDESVSVSFRASGEAYEGVVGNLSIDIIDLDSAGLTFLDNDRQIITSLSQDEASSGSFMVRLDTRPSATVRVRLTQSSNPDVIADIDTATDGIQTDLFFTASNWNTGQAVAFTVAEDDDADNDSASIAFEASGGGYDGVSDTLSITTIDDDTADLILSELTSTDTTERLTVTEGGDSTFKVRLATRPKNAVSVALAQSSGTGLTLSPSSLSFTSSNWNEAQAVKVTAAEDQDAVDDETGISLEGSGGKYDSVTADILVTVKDNDTEGLKINPTDPALVEGGGNTLTVKLETLPSSNVTVTLTQPSKTDLTFSPDRLIFKNTDWDKAQTVTLAAGEDQDVANDSADITLTASGGGYDGVTDTVSVSIIDNDAAHIALSLTKLDLIEGGAEGTFTIRLTKMPGSDVTVNVTSRPSNADLTIDADLDVSGNQDALVFTTDDWNIVKTATIIADDDDDLVDDRASIILTGSGGGYDDASGRVEVSVADDDTAGILLSRTALRLTEGGSVSFTVRLEAQPSADVTVSIPQPSNRDVSVSPAVMTFTPTDWDAERTVILGAADDDDAANESASIELGVSGGGYDNITGTVEVSVADDDTPSLTISPMNLTIFEGDRETFIVKLATLPTANVVVDLAQPSNADVSLSPARLSFASDSWNQGQTITVSAAEDHDAESEDVSVSLAASGGDYDGITGNLEVRITDSDTPPALVLSPPTLTVTEGVAAKLKVKLLTRPVANVKVSVAQAANPDVTVDTDTNMPGRQEDLVFTNKSWNTFQLITVFAAKDDDAEDDRASLALTASGDTYNGVVSEMKVSVIDDSTTIPGLILSPRDLSVDEGAGDRLMVNLATRPSADVMVNFARPSNPDVAIDTDGNATGNQHALFFTSLNWNLAQAAIVSAAQDSDAHDDRANISLTASGGDYGGITDNIAVSVVDDDTPPGVILFPSKSMTVTEGDDGIFTVRLATQPSAGVMLTLTQPLNAILRVDTDPKKDGYQNRLFFTRTDWNQVQAVTVSAARDENDVDDRASTSLYGSGAKEYSNIGARLDIVAIEFDPSLSWPVKSVIPAIPPPSAHDTASLRIRCKERYEKCDVLLDCTAQDGTIHRGHLNPPIAAMNTRTVSPQGIVDIVGGDWSGKGRLSCPLRSSKDISGQIWTRSGDGVLVNNSEILRSVEVEGVRGRIHHQVDIESIPSPGDSNLSNIRVRCESGADCDDVIFNCYEDDGTQYSGSLGFIGRGYTRHLQTEELSSMIGHDWYGMGLSCEVISDHPLSVQVLTRTGGGRALVNNSATGITGN